MMKNKEIVVQHNNVNKEKNLWASVLTEALRALNKGRPEERREVHNWFFKDKHKHNINSFVGVCETLDFDPDVLRKRIMKLSLPITNTPVKKKRKAKGSVVLTAFGESKSIKEWAIDSRCNATLNTLTNRIYGLKWKHERAIVTPPLKIGYSLNKKTSENSVGIENKT